MLDRFKRNYFIEILIGEFKAGTIKLFEFKIVFFPAGITASFFLGFNLFLFFIRYAEVEHDCTIGLKLHPSNAKAFWRRGVARREQGKLNEAKQGIRT